MGRNDEPVLVAGADGAELELEVVVGHLGGGWLLGSGDIVAVVGDGLGLGGRRRRGRDGHDIVLAGAQARIGRHGGRVGVLGRVGAYWVVSCRVASSVNRICRLFHVSDGPAAV